jgi:selenocysteine-specific elongation factor
MVRRGQVVERDGICFHPRAVDTAARAAAALLQQHPAGFTMAQFRDALGITRKHAIPLANELDARAITRRRDDLRIAGPRLPA